MPRWGMVIDLDKCTSCEACVTACQVENNVAPSNPKFAKMGRNIKWMQIMPVKEGEYPNEEVQLIPTPCMHCDHPPCIKVCPVGATQIGSEGIVGQIFARCIGCRYCTAACPYTVRYFNWYPPEWPEGMEKSMSKDVSIRPKGVVEKCTFCSHRLQKARDKAAAEGREMRPEEYRPECMETCPSGAISFGDLEDPNSTVSKLARNKRAFRLLHDLGTHPKVIYLREGG